MSVFEFFRGLIFTVVLIGFPVVLWLAFLDMDSDPGRFRNIGGIGSPPRPPWKRKRRR